MTAFGDELRNLIAKKAEQLDVAEFYRRRQAAEKERKETELDAAAAGLVKDVFRPLLQEFCAALAAAGVFQRYTRAESVLDGAHLATASCLGRRSQYDVRLSAAASAAGRIELAANAEVRGRRSEVREHERDDQAGWQALFDTTNTADTTDAADSPPLETPRSRLATPLVEIAPESIAPDPASMAAEQWCRAALKKCAEACVAAERGGKRS